MVCAQTQLCSRGLLLLGQPRISREEQQRGQTSKRSPGQSRVLAHAEKIRMVRSQASRVGLSQGPGPHWGHPH